MSYKGLGLSVNNVLLGLKFSLDLLFFFLKLGLLSCSDGWSSHESGDFLHSDGYNSLNFLSSSDLSLGISNLFCGDCGLLLVLGDSECVVGEDLFSFLSLGQSLLVRSNEHILQIGDLNLVLSLVLKSSGSVVNSSRSDNGF